MNEHRRYSTNPCLLLERASGVHSIPLGPCKAKQRHRVEQRRQRIALEVSLLQQESDASTMESEQLKVAKRAEQETLREAWSRALRRMKRRLFIGLAGFFI